MRGWQMGRPVGINSFEIWCVFPLNHYYSDVTSQTRIHGCIPVWHYHQMSEDDGHIKARFGRGFECADTAPRASTVSASGREPRKRADKSCCFAEARVMTLGGC